MTIDVTSVNDAPAGTDNTVTVDEDGTHVFAAGEFGFSDSDSGQRLRRGARSPRCRRRAP